MEPRVLLRRAANRARNSPDGFTRRVFQLAKLAYRTLGRWFPSLRLGWMSALRSAVWDGDDLVLGGWAFVRGVDFGPDPRFELTLRSGLGRTRLRAETTRVKDDDVLGVVQNVDLRYEQMGFRARLAGAQLAALPAGRRWRIRVRIVGDHRRTFGPLTRLYSYG